MPDSVSNSDIDAILRRQISSVAAQEKCERNDPNEISAYLEGALSSKRVADFEQHLVNCGICRRAVIELRALDDEEESPISETVKADGQTDKTDSNVPALGIVERLRKLLFGSGGSGYMWRPAAALVMVLLIVAAPAILFLRQPRQAADSFKADHANKSEKPAENKPADGSTNFSNDANGTYALQPQPSAGKTVEPAASAQPSNVGAVDAIEQPAGVAGNARAAGPPPGSPAPAPPPPPPTVVASGADKDGSPPKSLEEKQLRDQQLDKLQREAGNLSASNQAYGATLTWNVTVSMTPVDAQRSFGAIGGGARARDEVNSPDRAGGAKGQTEQPQQQPQASAKTAPRGKNETNDSETRADDAKRKEAVAKKPADSPVPYDKRVGQILKARFDKLMEDKVRSGTGVTVKIRIGPDGSVISLKDGKVLDSDITKRSSNDIVNTAVMKAITEGKLPAFGETEKDYSQVILIVKFEPTVN